jgi:hypothetical protein
VIVASGALGSRVARAARPAVRTSTIAMAMKIRPSVMAAPVTWWTAAAIGYAQRHHIG